MTDAEIVLWKRLKAKQLDGVKFRRQEQIGRFIVDFVCFENGLVIEADGGQHAVEKEKDEERTLWLNSQGFTVLRFWNNDILSNTEAVIEAIRSACVNSPSPRPSPTEGRGR
jgi:very-short-patch-repair endonuclease